MKRITTSTSTDALIKAMEYADDMHGAIVLWLDGNNCIGVSHDADICVSEAIYMLESFKHEILSQQCRKDEGE